MVVEKIAEPVPLRNAPIAFIDGAVAPTFHRAIHFTICQQQERGTTKMGVHAPWCPEREGEREAMTQFRKFLWYFQYYLVAAAMGLSIH